MMALGRYGTISEGDSLTLNVKVRRFEFGDSIQAFSGTHKLSSVPFTLGPWKGNAYVVSGNELKTDENSITLEFDLDLEIDSEERPTISEMLILFFGAKPYEGKASPPTS